MATLSLGLAAEPVRGNDIQPVSDVVKSGLISNISTQACAAISRTVFDVFTPGPHYR
jgi:hypothetical protein